MYILELLQVEKRGFCMLEVNFTNLYAYRSNCSLIWLTTNWRVCFISGNQLVSKKSFASLHLISLDIITPGGSERFSFPRSFVFFIIDLFSNTGIGPIRFTSPTFFLQRSPRQKSDRQDLACSPSPLQLKFFSSSLPLPFSARIRQPWRWQTCHSRVFNLSHCGSCCILLSGWPRRKQ